MYHNSRAKSWIQYIVPTSLFLNHNFMGAIDRIYSYFQVQNTVSQQRRKDYEEKIDNIGDRSPLCYCFWNGSAGLE
jgi:hypothetical protein